MTLSRGSTGSILRYLFYPSITSSATANYEDEVDVRAGAHSDYGKYHFALQQPGQPGLEILTQEGTWAPVPVWPDVMEIRILNLTVPAYSNQYW